MYAVNFTEIRAQGIDKPDQKWPMTSCRNGWEYNFTDIPYATVATEVCLKESETIQKGL